MLYLLDANVLIDANRDYYPISRVPEFWEWLIDQGEEGSVKIPVEMYEEVTGGGDELANWLKQPEVKSALLYQKEAEVEIVTQVINEGYAADLNDVEIEKIGKDPFIVAHAIPIEARVVTTEVSKPSKQRSNRKLPDVCQDFGVSSINTFQFIRALNFTTKWNAAN